MAKASAMIRASSTLKARGFLLLAPDVTLSRRTPYDETPSRETYLSVSFKMGNLFQIEELLEKKCLFRKRVWKLR